MEPQQNAPTQVIGRGSLEVEPKMQAVREELAAIDKMLDDLKKKADSLFDGVGEKMREMQRSVVPAPGSAEAQNMLSQANEERWREDLIEEVRAIKLGVEELQSRDPG